MLISRLFLPSHGEKKKSFWCSFEAEHDAKIQADLSSSSLLMLTIFSVEHGDSGRRLADSSGLLYAGLETDYGCLCGGPQQGTCPSPKLWNKQFPWGLHLSLLQACIPHLTLVPGRSWGGLCSHKVSSTQANGPCLHQLLVKLGGSSFSRSLMGGVSTSSNWAVLQYKMLFENQCSFVGRSSLSPLSPWPRHGAESQALQHLGNGWQQATFTRGQSLV